MLLLLQRHPWRAVVRQSESVGLVVGFLVFVFALAVLAAGHAIEHGQLPAPGQLPAVFFPQPPAPFVDRLGVRGRGGDAAGSQQLIPIRSGCPKCVIGGFKIRL